PTKCGVRTAIQGRSAAGAAAAQTAMATPAAARRKLERDDDARFNCSLAPEVGFGTRTPFRLARRATKVPRRMLRAPLTTRLPRPRLLRQEGEGGSWLRLS